MWKWMGLFLMKSSFKNLGLAFSSKLDWGSYITSIANTASKKVGALIRSMKFLSPEVALCISINLPYTHVCHVWASVPICSLELFDKLQKWICRTVGPSLAASLEPLVHRRNMVSLKLVSAIFYQMFVFPPNDSSSETTKSVLYFIKKALSILIIFKLL